MRNIYIERESFFVFICIFFVVIFPLVESLDEMSPFELTGGFFAYELNGAVVENVYVNVARKRIFVISGSFHYCRLPTAMSRSRRLCTPIMVEQPQENASYRGEEADLCCHSC